MMEDPTFPYHVGQLQGAAEMCAHWMQMQDDHATKKMGEHLEAVVGWFFEGEKVNVEK